jgi:hypothetical protein
MVRYILLAKLRKTLTMSGEKPLALSDLRSKSYRRVIFIHSKGDAHAMRLH